MAGGVKVAFTSPLSADNDPVQTAIPGTVGNKVRRGQVVPHKVVVTTAAAGLLWGRAGADTEHSPLA